MHHLHNYTLYLNNGNYVIKIVECLCPYLLPSFCHSLRICQHTLANHLGATWLQPAHWYFVLCSSVVLQSFFFLLAGALERLPYTASGRLCCYCGRFMRALVTASFHLWDSAVGDRNFSILFTFRLNFHVNGSRSFDCTESYKELCQRFMPYLSYHIT